MTTGVAEEVQALKEKGNGCFQEGKYDEAILHYSHAVKLDPKNFSLYSNRSIAFLKIKQYFHAVEDAMETIRLKPEWPKGYFRKGEAEAAAYQFSDALVSYQLALRLQPNDPTIEEAIKQTTSKMKKEKKADEQYPWLGAGVGIIFGVGIVMADQLTPKPSISHPLAMALVTIAVALLGFGLAKGYRHRLSYERKGLLDPPLDLLKEMKRETEGKNEEGEKSPTNNYQRYTKAQARQKLRKGKLS